MKTIAFFNNKGGVGKTSLVYHLAWMFHDMGLNVVAADLDPQANLSSMFLEEDRLEDLWPEGDHPKSIFGAIRPILRGIGDIAEAHLEIITDRLGLLVGDLSLSAFEDKLSDAWPRCLDRRDEAAFRAISALSRIVQAAARAGKADIALIDVGPNLGAINRAAIIGADCVAIPLAPDLFSLQGLRNLGPTLRQWRGDWAERLERSPDKSLELPPGAMRPLGYIVQQHFVRVDRPVKAFGRWMERIPIEYRKSVLGQTVEPKDTYQDDPCCLAKLKNYRSLMPMAMEARKPIFHLKPADGAIGSHMLAAQEVRKDFHSLAKRLASEAVIELPAFPKNAGLYAEL